MSRKPRVALVQAPIFEWTTPSNGIALIAAHLSAHGIPVRAYDASMPIKKKLHALVGGEWEYREEMVRTAAQRPELMSRLLDEQIERVLSFEPDFVGFSVLTGTEDWSLEMAGRIKARAPRCKIVFGGSQCMREILALDFIKHPAVDVVIIGEADLSSVAFFSAWDPTAAKLPRTPGVLLKEDGRIFDGGDGPEFEDLDRLPFLDFSGFDMDDYAGERMFLSSSRGCVRKCSFCTHIVQQKVFRHMSAARTVREVKHHLSRYPSRALVDVNDSLVNGNVRRLSELADAFIAYRGERLVTHPGTDFGWTGMAIIHPTMTKALLKKMRWSGCRSLRYGLESGSQKMVDLMQKNFRVADAEGVIRDTHEAGVGVHLFLLVGFPGETDEDFKMTLDFVERNAENIDGASVSFCEIQKGSHLDLHAEQYDIRVPVEDQTAWVSRDGSNTLALRQERARIAQDLVKRLGLWTRIHTTKVGDFKKVPGAPA